MEWTFVNLNLDERMHLAICIWGLLRSVPFTIKSFHTNILGPIQFSNYSYDIFLHSYTLSKPHNNIPTGEVNITLNTSDWHLFLPQYVYLENQGDFDQHINYNLFKKQGDPWRNGYVSFKNQLRALNSLHHVTSVVESVMTGHQRSYDAMIFVRPDVTYLTPLPMAILSSIPSLAKTKGFERTIFVPDFHRSCDEMKREVNDRFAITTVEGGMIYGKRLQQAYNYSQSHLIHSEPFLGHVLGQGMNNSPMVIEIPFYVQRIRSDGRMNHRDILLPRQMSPLADKKIGNYQYHDDSESSYSIFGKLVSFVYSKWMNSMYDPWYRWYIDVMCHPNPLRISYKELDRIPELSLTSVSGTTVAVTLPIESINCSIQEISMGHNSRVFIPQQCIVLPEESQHGKPIIPNLNDTFKTLALSMFPWLHKKVFQKKPRIHRDNFWLQNSTINKYKVTKRKKRTQQLRQRKRSTTF